MSSRREFGAGPSDKGKAVAGSSDKGKAVAGSEVSGDYDDDWSDNILLFEMEAPSTNRLVIPFELASAHFPPLATPTVNQKQVETIQITDSQHNEWHMPIQYYEEERGFMILIGWQKFSTQYNVQPMDLISIFKPRHQLHIHHFLIEVEKTGQRIDPPEFREENFLFQIELEKSDIDFSSIFLSRDDVTTNFPAAQIEPDSKDPNGVKKVKKIMRFTDAKGKDWYMNIMRYEEGKYMLMEGWDEFVKERGLEAGDLIRFYKHLQPYHTKHYLIGIVKKEGRGGRS